MHLTTDPKNPCRLLDENGLFVAGVGNAEDAAAVVLACNTHARLAAALAQCMNFIEHKCANEGQATTKEEWARNVERFRRDVGKVGIGRSYTDEAVVDLRAARAVLDEVKRFSGEALRTSGDGTAAGSCATSAHMSIDGK